MIAISLDKYYTYRIDYAFHSYHYLSQYKYNGATRNLSARNLKKITLTDTQRS